MSSTVQNSSANLTSAIWRQSALAGRAHGCPPSAELRPSLRGMRRSDSTATVHRITLASAQRGTTSKSNSESNGASRNSKCHHSMAYGLNPTDTISSRRSRRLFEASFPTSESTFATGSKQSAADRFLCLGRPWLSVARAVSPERPEFQCSVGRPPADGQDLVVQA